MGRPVHARKCYDYWMLQASNNHQYEWIVSLSKGDPEIDNYYHAFANSTAVLIVSSTKNMVQATNEAAKLTAGELMILVSDDMFAPIHWDERILHKYEMIDGPGILQVNDGITTLKLTIPIMNRLAYAKLGYMYHPGYISMYADDDLRRTAIRHGMYYNGTDILIEHRHYTVGKSKFDRTYQLENNQKAWKHGEKLYYQRIKDNFPL